MTFQQSGRVSRIRDPLTERGGTPRRSGRASRVQPLGSPLISGLLTCGVNICAAEHYRARMAPLVKILALVAALWAALCLEPAGARQTQCSELEGLSNGAAEA